MPNEMSHKIENLRDRLELFCLLVPHDGDLFRDPKRRIERVRYEHLRNLIVEMRIGARSDYPSVQSWNHWMKGRDVPDSIISSILRIFPSVPRSLLIVESYGEFQSRWGVAWSLESDWRAACDRVLRDRNTFSDIALKYYAGVNDLESELPLISGSGWILKKPQELLRDDPPPRVVDHPDVRGRPLSDEGMVSYAMVKKQSANESVKKRLWDGTSYRVMEISAHGDRLDFIFAMGGYYNFLVFHA